MEKYKELTQEFIPISCVIVGIGMLFGFWAGLVAFGLTMYISNHLV
jgi:hypothetical protein